MWRDFNNRTRPVRRINIWKWSAAAAIIILIGSTYYINQNVGKTNDQLVYERLVLIDPDLAAEQVSMIKMIDQQNELISQIGLTQELYPDLFEELNYIDSLQMETINDLKLFGDKSNLIKTLLKHYERKARVLELMLYEFEKQESETEYETAKQI